MSNETVIPLGEYADGDFYPGYEPRLESRPFLAEPLAPFTRDDESRFWMRDSQHFSEGITPASMGLLEDAQTWGTQYGAEIVGIPPTAGMVNRIAGVHVYLGQCPITSPWQIGARAERFGAFAGPRLADFATYWAGYRAELEAAYAHFDGLDVDALSLDELHDALKDAHAFHRRGWGVHFEVMYLLAANYVGFFQLASDLGLDTGQIAQWLAGEETSYLHTDAELWRLAGRARELDVAVALTEPTVEAVRAALDAAPQGATWWAEFEAFLAVWGQRTDETATMDRPSWAEHPATPLASIREFLTRPEGHDFAAARRDVLAERDRLVDEARATLTEEGRVAFDQALASNRSANFVWWNEEHNFLIDRRIHLPVRRLTLAVADRLVAEGRLGAREDVFFLFRHELLDMLGGGGPSDVPALVVARRDYYDHWSARGSELPPVVGSVPDAVHDPIMTELFGLTPEYFATIKAQGTAKSLSGFAAGRGTVVGTARVVRAAQDIDQVRDGDVLVCGGTTTEWTPVFGLVVGCVTDTGGTLSHTAIIAREYGIPCVVGTGVATSTISTGDRVRIDGDRGVVEVLA
ncbi:PEP-utilizing enzyme [Actinomycetospora callitridis]|uniref:PEP-utilizing enzyme n=1 Tax=Actinomycetospora callitridis TaxID=913944 RepID=UPI00236527D4|nr:PEP-utilizing enzyme [Actinomycetospora callitridis]MDD7920029.1 PEP-utilizing enzyme [Actinomycetospora callitridis]